MARPAVLLAVIGVAICSLLPLEVTGSVFRTEREADISTLHVIDDDFYFAGGRLTVDGRIEGDLVAVVWEPVIRGEIRESASLACDSLTFSGTVNGSLRALGRDLLVDGRVRRSVDLFGAVARVGKSADIDGNLSIFATVAYIDGVVDGDLQVSADEVYITGEINGNATITAPAIVITPPGTIVGDLSYVAPDKDALKLVAGARVNGETEWLPPEEPESESPYTGYIVRIATLLAAFLFGIIVVRPFRPYAEEAVGQLCGRPAMSAASGLLGTIGLVICIVILMLSLAVMASGYLILRLSSEGTGWGMLFLVVSTVLVPITSFASITGGVILYSGKVLVAFVLGHYVVRIVKPKSRALTASSLLIGLIILLILFSLPYLGTLLYAAVSIIGAGAILLGIRYCRRQASLPPPSTAPPEPTPPPSLPVGDDQ